MQWKNIAVTVGLAVLGTIIAAYFFPSYRRMLAVGPKPTAPTT